MSRIDSKQLALEHANRPTRSRRGVEGTHFSRGSKHTAVRMHKHFSDDNRYLAERKIGLFEPYLIMIKLGGATDRFGGLFQFTLVDKQDSASPLPNFELFS